MPWDSLRPANGSEGRGRPACGRLAGVRWAALVPVLAILLVPSCSEIEEPLEWRDSARGGLGQAPVTISADSLVDAHLSYPAYVSTGSSSYFLAGVLDRGDTRLESSAYLRWDLEDLPDGTILRAYVQLILRNVEQADSSAVGPFRLWMYDLAEAWDEDSLETPPARGGFIAGNGEITTGGVSDTSDVLLPTLFDDSGLIGLVGDWRRGHKENYGVVLRPDDQSEQGFLRLISSEGAPQGTVSDIATPALVIEIDLGTKDTLITKEAIADAYVIDVAGEIVLGESELLISSGYVRRGLLGLDLQNLIRQEPDSFPLGSVVHRATLTIRVVPESDWQLPADETLTMWVYETEDAWSENQAPDSIAASYVSQTIVTASDSVAVLDVRGPVQGIFEGRDPGLFLRCASEVGIFRSVLFSVGEPSGRPPVLDVSIARPSPGRLGNGP